MRFVRNITIKIEKNKKIFGSPNSNWARPFLHLCVCVFWGLKSGHILCLTIDTTSHSSLILVKVTNLTMVRLWKIWNFNWLQCPLHINTEKLHSRVVNADIKGRFCTFRHWIHHAMGLIKPPSSLTIPERYQSTLFTHSNIPKTPSKSLPPLNSRGIIFRGRIGHAKQFRLPSQTREYLIISLLNIIFKLNEVHPIRKIQRWNRAISAIR